MVTLSETEYMGQQRAIHPITLTQIKHHTYFILQLPFSYNIKSELVIFCVIITILWNLNDKNLVLTVAAFPWCTAVYTQLADVSNNSHVLTTTDSKHRMNLISDRTKGLSSQSSKQVEIVRFLLHPAGKQRRSLIQTRLKAQGNLRLVTTNVGLNSSSHYLWGEQERVQPKTIQKRATVWVKTCTNAQKKKKKTLGSETASILQSPPRGFAFHLKKLASLFLCD